MNLKQISEIYAEKTGDTVGFELRSLKSQKTFKAIAKSPNGGFLVVTTTDPVKEYLLRGDVDQYELVEQTSAQTLARIEEIKGQITTLRNEVNGLEYTLETKLDYLHELENELDALVE